MSAAPAGRMRVIAGTARGVQLTAPRDRGTRPITDRVKETLFGILGDRVVDARVLDLYAGSGAVGIEALSRGAGHVTFVEAGACRNHGHCAPTSNATRLAAAASVHQQDVLRFLGSVDDAAWDLVVLDPPYEERAILAPLERIVPLLAPGGDGRRQALLADPDDLAAGADRDPRAPVRRDHAHLLRHDRSSP